MTSSTHCGTDVLGYFRNVAQRIYYASHTPVTIAGGHDWINGLEWLSSVDSFDGGHPHNFVATDVPFVDSVEEALCRLLDSEQVARHVAGRPGVLLTLMFDERAERRAAELGLRMGFPAAALRRRLDGKLEATRLAEAAGVAAVPHVVATLRDDVASLDDVAAQLGSRDLVVQLDSGHSGTTTFFVASKADFDAHAAAIVGQPVKVMPRLVACTPAAVEGCVTRQGVLVGPLMTELIGVAELTPYRAGWCGNELFAADSRLPAELRRRACAATMAIGGQLQAHGYVGVFGVDYLIDAHSGQLYFGELNARLTGVTPLTCLAALHADQPPLLLYHLLEHLGTVDYDVDVREYNARWCAPTSAAGWSLMVVKHTDDAPAVVERAPRSGVWRMDRGGRAGFDREAANPQQLSDDGDEAYVVRTVDPGHRLVKGTVCARLILRTRITDSSGQLNGLAKQWLRAVRASYVCELI